MRNMRKMIKAGDKIVHRANIIKTDAYSKTPPLACLNVWVSKWAG